VSLYHIMCHRGAVTTICYIVQLWARDCSHAYQQCRKHGYVPLHVVN
jgi:hypothetical protein